MEAQLKKDKKVLIIRKFYIIFVEEKWIGGKW